MGAWGPSTQDVRNSGSYSMFTEKYRRGFCSMYYGHLMKLFGKFKTRDFQPFINQNMFTEDIRHYAIHWGFKNEKEKIQMPITLSLHTS